MEATVEPDSSNAGEALHFIRKGFWDRNQPLLQGILDNPPIFYHTYPNVDVQVASFNTPAKAVPSLHHHKLGEINLTRSEHFLERLKSVQSKHCTFLVGGKGCGKTRLLYELLARNFGFYFKASKVENGESRDFIGITETMTVACKAAESPSRRSIDVEAALCAVVSRLVILSKCLELKPELTPLQWLVCQTECRPRDLFWELTSLFIKQEFSVGFLEGCFSGLTQDVYEKIKGSLASEKFLFVVDEAQSASRSRAKDDTAAAKLKSLIAESLKAFRTECSVPTACTLAGTGNQLLTEAYEMDQANLGVSYDICSASETYEDADSFQAFSEYVSGFLGQGDYKKLFDKYYQARAGTIASALHHYINRRIPRENAMEYLEEFALTLATQHGCQLGMPFSLHDTLSVAKNDRFLHYMLREVTEAFYLGGKSYLFAHNSSVKFVELGLATLKMGPVKPNQQETTIREASLNKSTMVWHYSVSAFINERIVQAALCHAFVPKVKEEILERYTGVQRDTERAAYFEKYCPVFVLDLFSRDLSLEKTFGEEEAPELMMTEQRSRSNSRHLEERGKGVENKGRLRSKNEQVGGSEKKQDRNLEMEFAPHLEHAKGAMSEEASSLVRERIKLSSPPVGTPLMVKLGPNYTFERWLNEGTNRPTFLQTKTDNQFGPDLIALLQVPKRKQHLLLSIQVRPGMTAERLDPRLFFSHNKLREVAERNRENSKLLSEYWSGGWLELFFAPYARLQHDQRPFPDNKVCIRTSIDKSNLYRVFPKLLNHIRRR